MPSSFRRGTASFWEVWPGFSDLAAWGLTDRVPRLIAVQPAGACALVSALNDGADDVTPSLGASSVADSLVVDAPRNARSALRRIRRSGGGGVIVDDETIVRWIARLARLTGVFAEPAAAAAPSPCRRRSGPISGISPPASAPGNPRGESSTQDARRHEERTHHHGENGVGGEKCGIDPLEIVRRHQCVATPIGDVAVPVIRLNRPILSTDRIFAIPESGPPAKEWRIF